MGAIGVMFTAEGVDSLGLTIWFSVFIHIGGVISGIPVAPLEGRADMTGETIVTMMFGVLVGVAATVTMDVLASVARRAGLIVGAKGQWVGRWYLGIARGQFIHSNIAAAPEQAGEKRAALIGHYLIGIALAVLYVVGAGWLGVSPGTFLVALGYGLATCVFPWFLMYPAFGFGLLGIKGPPELRLFTTSLINHLFYGFGLWWIAEIFPLG
jgi:hypothetical protein